MEVIYFLLTQEDMRFRMLHTAEVAVFPQAYAPGGYATHRAVVEQHLPNLRQNSR
jgi:hypothetical protein